MAAEGPFITRWSRRKLAPLADAPPATVPAGTDPPADAADETGTVDGETIELPDIDSLDKDSDYTVFMRDGVPEELKRLALRALWRSDPVFANLDGLNDYDEDFAAAMRVGAAFMRKLARAELGSESETDEQAGEEEQDEQADADQAAVEVPPPDDGEAPPPDDGEAPLPDEDEAQRRESEFAGDNSAVPEK